MNKGNKIKQKSKKNVFATRRSLGDYFHNKFKQNCKKNNFAGWRALGDYSQNVNSTGAHSTGNWSISDRSTGDFSVKDGEYMMFDKPCTRDEYWMPRPKWLFFETAKWIDPLNLTELEKQEDSKMYGYFKVTSYEEAAQQSWLDTTQEDRLATLELPNFDKDIFKQIFEIDVDDPKWLVVRKVNIK